MKDTTTSKEAEPKKEKQLSELEEHVTILKQQLIELKSHSLDVYATLRRAPPETAEDDSKVRQATDTRITELSEETKDMTSIVSYIRIVLRDIEDIVN